MITNEIVYCWFDSFLCLFGIFFNSVLIYCIATKSPKTIATYSFLLMNLAVSDLAACLVTLFVEPRIIISGDDIYYIGNGFCSLINHQACYLGYGIMVTLYGHLTISQLASFVYRWYIFRWETPGKMAMGIAVFVVWLPTLFVFFAGVLPFLLSNVNETYKEEIAAIHPELDVSSLTTFGVPNAMVDIRPKIPSFYVTIPVLPITALIFFLRRYILKNLTQHGLFSETTKKLHQSLLQALTLQALLPLLYLVGIALWQFAWQMQTRHIFWEYVPHFLCGLIPILAPLFPLYFVTSYKKFLARFMFSKYRVEQSNTNLTPSFTLPSASVSSNRPIISITKP